MRTFFLVFICIASISLQAAAGTGRSITQNTILHGIAVASSCRVMVDAAGTRNNQIAFGTYNKSTAEDSPVRTFTLRLYEDGSTVPGCSAFQVSPISIISFGNDGQLDEQGVVTRGAGDGIRIDVRAVDIEASSKKRVTIHNDTIEYPSEFASKGKIIFSAKPLNLEKAEAGEYRGTLSFVISYQ